MGWAWQQCRGQRSGDTGQHMERSERGVCTCWKGKTLGLVRAWQKSEHARDTLAGEDVDGTVPTFSRENWSEDRKKASERGTLTLVRTQDESECVL